MARSSSRDGGEADSNLGNGTDWKDPSFKGSPLRIFALRSQDPIVVPAPGSYKDTTDQQEAEREKEGADFFFARPLKIPAGRNFAEKRHQNQD